MVPIYAKVLVYCSKEYLQHSCTYIKSVKALFLKLLFTLENPSILPPSLQDVLQRSVSNTQIELHLNEHWHYTHSTHKITKRGKKTGGLSPPFFSLLFFPAFFLSWPSCCSWQNSYRDVPLQAALCIKVLLLILHRSEAMDGYVFNRGLSARHFSHPEQCRKQQSNAKHQGEDERKTGQTAPSWLLETLLQLPALWDNSSPNSVSRQPIWASE